MAPVDLNQDVLASVSQFLTDKSDVLSLSLTCSTLRRIAIERLLSMGPIRFADTTSVLSFHAFLFVDASSRGPYVRAIAVDWNTDEHSHKLMNQGQPEDYTLVVEILTSCTNLERIEISIYSDPPPHIIEAFRTPFPSLRSLLIFGWSAKASALLCALCAPLRVLSLQSELSKWKEEDPWEPTLLGNVLSHLAPTLEELEIDQLIVDPRRLRVQPAPPISSLVQYPAVRSLTLGFTVGRPLLDHLQHLFPGLCGTLTFQAHDGSALEDGDNPSIRAANTLSQDDDGAWKKLDRLVCDPVMFYALSLHCPIRLVMLSYISADTQGYVTEALRDHPVPRLKISLLLRYGLGILDGLLPPEIAGTLTHLTIVLEYAQAGLPRLGDHLLCLTRIRWDDLLARTISMLQPLHKLTHLRLAVHSDVSYVPANWPKEGLKAFVRAVHGDTFDFAGTASALVRALQSLQYLFLTTSGSVSDEVATPDDATEHFQEEWNASRGWRVVESCSSHLESVSATNRVRSPLQDCERVLVDLEDTVAETIVRREELFLSEDEAEPSRGDR